MALDLNIAIISYLDANRLMIFILHSIKPLHNIPILIPSFELLPHITFDKTFYCKFKNTKGIASYPARLFTNLPIYWKLLIYFNNPYALNFIWMVAYKNILSRNIHLLNVSKCYYSEYILIEILKLYWFVYLVTSVNNKKLFNWVIL